MKHILLGSILLLFGCANIIPVELDPKVFYENDMAITVDGFTYYGVGVTPKSSIYHIKIESKEDVDLLTITSCHRQINVESAIKTGWFHLKRGYEFDYQPDEIESTGSCLLRFGAYSKASGEHSWSLLDFKSDAETLPAHYSCNGYQYDQVGVGICQSHQGLIQSFKFPVPVKIAVNSISDKCKIPIPQDGMSWTFPLANRECVYLFKQINGTGIHRLTTIGYEQVPVRGQ